MINNDKKINQGWAVQRLYKDSPVQRKIMEFSFLSVCRAHQAYKPFFDISSETAGMKNWSEFPCIDKNFVRENFDLFLDYAGLSQADLENHLGQFSLGKTLRDHLVFHSSGSSGKKSYSIYSKQAFGKSLFELYRKTLLPYNINNMAYIGLIDRYNGGNQWMYFLKPVINVSFIDILSPLKKIKDELASSKPEAIFTKPSMLVRLIDETGLDRKSLPMLQHIISVGENITEHQREYIIKNLGVVPLNSFSTTETGPIGFQKGPQEDGLSLYNTLNRVEVLDENGDPVTEADIPGRLVVSNLYNTSFPLLRYDLKDVVAWLPGKVGEEITPVLGRCDKDLVFYHGALTINEWVLWNIVIDMADALQFQKLSENTLNVRVVRRNDSVNEDYFVYCIKEQLMWHGIESSPLINIEFVENIPMDTNTSKVKKVL